MSQEIINTIISDESTIRNRSVRELFQGKTVDELLRIAETLEIFRRKSDNLYHKVRASLFIFSLYRFFLIDRKDVKKLGHIPFNGVKAALNREYNQAIEIFRVSMMLHGMNEAILSALADAYYRLSFKYLADQVKLSISQSKGNNLLFLPQQDDDSPFRVKDEYTLKDSETGLYPIGADRSPVRADPCHSGWSDIFFLGMDFPAGARVINMSVDLAIHDRAIPESPIEVFCRMIDKPVIRIVSIDLSASKDVADLKELFNFGNDHLGLLKAGIVASGIVPPSMEGRQISLTRVLERFLGKPGGIELVTFVKDIPKGSRLAISTTLLATIITRLMRFSGQTRRMEGSLTEDERRIVASRAILGEWLGGSGGGWQDSGGIWPGIKVIEGVETSKGDPEYGVSHGRLLPSHHVLAKEQLTEEIESKLSKSIVMVHGGMSQNVGPILEMVTEKYLLRYNDEWEARLEGYDIFTEIVDAIKNGDMKKLGAHTSKDWRTTTKVIIPWATNAFTEDLISRVSETFGEDYWGFLMLGGMAGGGMAFIINPNVHDKFVEKVLDIMLELKNLYSRSLPFVMDPVVYDFKLNYEGVIADFKAGSNALMPKSYYSDALLNAHASGDKVWIDEHKPELKLLVQSKAGNNSRKVSLLDTGTLIDSLFPKLSNKKTGMKNATSSRWDEAEADRIKQQNGFDQTAHDKMKTMLKSGKIGTSMNRLPRTTLIEDVMSEHVQNAIFNNHNRAEEYTDAGVKALKRREAAVVTFSGGLGSRWTEGATVVKPINPFVMMAGKHRSFTEIHLAKSLRASREFGPQIQHVFTTSFLTHDPFETFLKQNNNFDYDGPVHLSRANAIGLRIFPMERDLRFIWEELPQQMLDGQQQKIIEDYHEAIITWTRENGEGEDYTDNAPESRFNPPGHWYEIPNMLRNGALAKLLKENPNLNYILAHNADTLGAYLDPCMLGMHIHSNKVISFEVTPRRFEDKGGGLALVNKHPQLLEALALPGEEDEYKLSYYNTLTSWITLDKLLNRFGLTRKNILDAAHDAGAADLVDRQVSELEQRMPTYIIIKEVKLLWGAGQEDIFPVAQFEKLWGDITRLEDFDVHYIAVNRQRGQQLKDPAQLDRWVADGSCKSIEDLAEFKK